MGKVVALHARFAGPHFRTQALRFGREWHTQYCADDVLEFSEYGRSPYFPHGAWLVASIGLGALMWMIIIAALF